MRRKKFNVLIRGFVLATFLLCGVPAWAQTPSQPTTSTQATPAPAMSAPLAVKEANPPAADQMAKGDPSGTLTGNVNDVPVSNPKVGLTLGDAVNQIGQNKVAINFVWTLVTGFLVMFMQAGFAAVETGLCRAKNANHTMMMNFMVYGLGLFAYWVCGFALQMGGAAGVVSLGGAAPLSGEFALHIAGKTWGLWGTHGFFLTQGGTYDVAVMVLFLFEMVFMDTAATIVTGGCAERWKFAAFAMSSVFLAAITYPLFANWAWGGGWLSQLGANYGLGAGYADFAGSGVVHAVGGLSALACAIIIGPRIGKYNRDGSSNAIPGHDITMVLLGCFILAFGWFGFNPGSTLGASGGGALRIATIAVDTMLAGATGSFGAVFYMWIRYGKPDASMSGNGLLAGLVAITAPSGFVNTIGAAIIGLVAGLIVCLSVEFIDRIAHIDDPVGAISVHGTCGLWGVLSVGLFADGTGMGNVKGLFYGNPGQLVAQMIGVATLLGCIFTLTFVFNLFVDYFVGQRVSAQAELEGLDIPEMGALGYPEFVLKMQGPGMAAGVA